MLKPFIHQPRRTQVKGGTVTAGKQGAWARSVLPERRQGELLGTWEAGDWGIQGRAPVRTVKCK